MSADGSVEPVSPDPVSPLVCVAPGAGFCEPEPVQPLSAPVTMAAVHNNATNLLFITLPFCHPLGGNTVFVIYYYRTAKLSLNSTDHNTLCKEPLEERIYQYDRYNYYYSNGHSY